MTKLYSKRVKLNQVESLFPHFTREAVFNLPSPKNPYVACRLQSDSRTPYLSCSQSGQNIGGIDEVQQMLSFSGSPLPSSLDWTKIRKKGEEAGLNGARLWRFHNGLQWSQDSSNNRFCRFFF